MKRLDATVHTVAMQDSKGLFYVSNLVLLGEEYYYFDVTLDIEVYLDSGEDEDLVLCCAGVGKEKYERYLYSIRPGLQHGDRRRHRADGLPRLHNVAGHRRPRRLHW